MAQESSNSAMEMGTSDQVLVTSKKNKSLTFILGGVAMLVVIGIVVALVVVLSGNNVNGDAEPIISTTEGPTTISTEPTTTTTTTTTELPTTVTDAPDITTTTTLPDTTTVAPEPPPDVPIDEQLDLDSIISGVFSPSSFNGTWSSANEISFRNANGELVSYNVDEDDYRVLVYNTSTILEQSSRVSQLSADGTNVVLAYGVAQVYRHSFLARYAAVNVDTGSEVDIVPTGVAANEAFLQNFVWGPSGTAHAFVYLNNIYYRSSLTSDAVQITTNGQINVVYNGIPDWVYEEEVFSSHNAMWFSKDGSRLAYVTFNDNDVRVMRVPHYGVPGSINYQYTQHHEIRYPKPGTINPNVTVTIRDLSDGSINTYEAPSDIDEPILKTVTFATNDSIALIWTDRAQTTMRINLCTDGQSSCSLIYSYSEPNGWIDNNPLIFNEQGSAFVTILPQLVNGVLYKQIVQISEGAAGSTWTTQNRINTAHTVADILQWNSDDTIWYKATNENDTSEQHIYSVDSSGFVSCFTCSVTREDGAACLYNDGSVSEGGSKIVINCVGPEIPQTLIYNTNGTFIKTWENNNETATLLSQYWLPETIRLSVPIGVGIPEADVQIQVPYMYENRVNVPLLVYVYGGPDTALVTKEWSVDWGTSLVSRWNIAVAHIDGRGSGLRGVDNMFSVNRRLGTYEIDDQIAVTRYLQENLPWVDSNRTCIWGWSYGGYAASLALARGGDVFRCGVAVAPVVDWRFYDTIYTERYMDTPENNPQGYANSSLLTDDVVEAYRNKRYFLIHGTADDNVHYQHAMLISRLLQTRDVYFTQMSYTDEEHGLLGVRPHLYHGIERFLQQNML